MTTPDWDNLDERVRRIESMLVEITGNLVGVTEAGKDLSEWCHGLEDCHGSKILENTKRIEDLEESCR